MPNANKAKRILAEVSSKQPDEILLSKPNQNSQVRSSLHLIKTARLDSPKFHQNSQMKFYFQNLTKTARLGLPFQYLIKTARLESLFKFNQNSQIRFKSPWS